MGTSVTRASDARPEADSMPTTDQRAGLAPDMSVAGSAQRLAIRTARRARGGNPARERRLPGSRRARGQERSRRMNWDRIAGNWMQFRGKVQEKWGKLTNDDLDRIAGQREQLVGSVRELYGILQDDAEKQVREWERELDRLHVS